MKIVETPISGLFVIEPTVFEDSRGCFFESFSETIHKEKGLDYNWVQENESKSNYGVVRGLHYQLNPHSQAKLVRVVVGKVLDVVIDIRKGSPTFGQKYAIELSGENKKQLLIPRGFAHGFSVLEDDTIFSYKCDQFYNKSSERGISPFDPTLAIDWNVAADKAIVSEKDTNSPVFSEADYNFEFQCL